MLFAGTGFHLAYTAMFFVTGVLAANAVPVPSGLVYQPSKVKPGLLGGGGKVTLLLVGTVICGIGGLLLSAPFLWKVTVTVLPTQ
jgi:hypothetical protein